MKLMELVAGSTAVMVTRPRRTRVASPPGRPAVSRRSTVTPSKGWLVREKGVPAWAAQRLIIPHGHPVARADLVEALAPLPDDHAQQRPRLRTAAAAQQEL